MRRPRGSARRSVGVVLLAGAVAVVATGCSDEGSGPGPEAASAPAAPPATAPASPAPAPGPPSPAPPQPASPAVTGEVEATLQAYAAGIQRGYADGSTSGVTASTTGDCTCRSVTQTVARYRDQGTVQGSRWSMQLQGPVQLTSPDAASVPVRLQATQAALLGPDGTLLQGIPPVDVTATAELRREDGRWLLARLAPPPAGATPAPAAA